MHPKMLTLIITSFIMILVINLIRHQKMTFKYALAWLASCTLVIVFTVQDPWIGALAEWAGFALTSNFIFFLLLIFVIFFSLLLTIHINEQNSRTESLAQAIAKLDHRLKKLEKEGSDEDR